MAYESTKEKKDQNKGTLFTGEVTKLLGFKVSTAMNDYINHGPLGSYSITEDDFRCDADSAEKLSTIVTTTSFILKKSPSAPH